MRSRRLKYRVRRVLHARMAKIHTLTQSPLLRTSVVVHFGRNAVGSFRAACQRMLGILITTITLGSMLSMSLYRAQLPHGLPLLWLCAVLSSVCFVVSGFIYFSLGLLSGKQSGNAFKRMMATLPVPRRTLWWVRYGADIFIFCVLVLSALLLGFALAHVFITHLVLVYASMSVGLIGGLGFYLLPVPQSLLFKSLMFLSSSLGLVYCLEKSLTLSQEASTILLIGCLAIPLLFAVGVWQSVEAVFSSLQQVTTNNHQPPILGKYVPLSWWLAVKAARNRRTMADFVIGMMFSTSMAVGLCVRHMLGTNSAGWLLFGALLASTFACDLRGISRRSQPAEATATKGLKSFVVSEVCLVFLVSIVVGLPILIVLMVGSKLAIAPLLLQFLAIQSFSAFVGLLAGTVFVPAAGDIGSQILSTLVTSSLILLFPRLAQFSQLGQYAQDIRWAAVASICLPIIYAIELTRRKNYGHARA